MEVVVAPPVTNQEHSTYVTQSTTVSSLIGPWKGVAETSLQERCRDAWYTPLDELSDLEVATFLNQKIAAPQMLVEPKRRLKSAFCLSQRAENGQKQRLNSGVFSSEKIPFRNV